MKKFLLFITGILCTITGLQAQTKPGPVRAAFAHSPVSWQYHAEKIGDNIYELHITARIRAGWHLYSQHQPGNAIALPTKIKFHDDPSIVFEGDPKEIGKREKSTIESLGISAYQYTGQVDFVQKVQVKETSSKSIIGSITYQVCKEKECLPPETAEFGIRLKE